MEVCKVDDKKTSERLESFVTRVAELRCEANVPTMKPHEVVQAAARSIGVGSMVLPLTYAGLRLSADRDGVILDDVRFWIAAACGVTSSAGGFALGWLDAFVEQFFGQVSGFRDLPSPYDLKMPREIASRFQVMLRSAVAMAESRGKVGKVSLNKCLGFREVKYWSENPGWIAGDGFCESDREMLKTLVGRLSVVCNEETHYIGKTHDELGDARRNVEELRQKLNDEQKKSWQSSNRLQTAEKELSQLKAEREKAATTREVQMNKIGECKQRIISLEEELSLCRSEIDRRDDDYQQRVEEIIRQKAQMENRVKGCSDLISEVVAPIRRQIDAVRGKPMSVEMGNVLLTHIGRIFAVLKDNGFEI